MAKLVNTFETIEQAIKTRSSNLVRMIQPQIDSIVMCDIKIENGLIGPPLESVKNYRQQCIDDLLYQINNSNILSTNG